MDFYSNLVACKTRIKIKGEKFKDKSQIPLQIRICDNLLPKLSRVLKIEGLNAKSRRSNPDERTRGGHVRKRVAISHAIARKRGHSRVFAAFWMRLVTNFRDRVVMGLYFLYLL